MFLLVICKQKSVEEEEVFPLTLLIRGCSADRQYCTEIMFIANRYLFYDTQCFQALITQHTIIVFNKLIIVKALFL